MTSETNNQKPDVADRYIYRVARSPEAEGEYMGLCSEFPSLSWMAGTIDEARSGIKELVREVVADLRHLKQRPPVPLVDRRYSGRLVLRIAPELHRRLVVYSEEEGIDLNEVLTSLLTEC